MMEQQTVSKHQILICHSLLLRWTTLSGGESRKATEDSHPQILHPFSTAIAMYLRQNRLWRRNHCREQEEECSSDCFGNFDSRNKSQHYATLVTLESSCVPVSVLRSPILLWESTAWSLIKMILK